MFFDEPEEGVCGTAYWTFDPHTGSKVSNVWTCKKFRDCPSCKAERLRKEVGDLIRTMSESPIYFAEMDNKGWRRFTRKLNSENYRRYPIGQDSVAVVTDTPIDGDVFDWSEVTPDNVKKVSRYAIIPEKTRTSGSLLKEEEVEVYEGPEEIVHVPVFYTNIEVDDEEYEIARIQAVKIFWQDLPNTAQDMVDTYHSCLSIVLQSRGIPKPGHDRDMFVLRTVKLEEVNWNGYNPLIHGDAQNFDDAKIRSSYEDLFGIRLGV